MVCKILVTLFRSYFVNILKYFLFGLSVLVVNSRKTREIAFYQTLQSLPKKNSVLQPHAHTPDSNLYQPSMDYQFQPVFLYERLQIVGLFDFINFLCSSSNLSISMYSGFQILLMENGSFGRLSLENTSLAKIKRKNKLLPILNK